MHISNQLLLDLQIASKLTRMETTFDLHSIASPEFTYELDWLCSNLFVQIPEGKHSDLISSLSRLNDTLINYPEDKLSWIEQYS